MKQWLIALAWALALGLRAEEAGEAEEAEEPFHAGGRLAVSVHGGFSTYTMADWNAAANLASASSVGTGGGASASAGGLYNGYNWGGSVRFAPIPQLEVGLEAENLGASGRTWSNFFTSPSSTAALSYAFPALYLGGQVRWRAVAYERAWYGLGLSLGSLSLSGANSSTEDIFSNGARSSDSYSGSGIGGKILVCADWFLGEKVSLTSQAGYRYAVIPEFKGNNGVATRPGGGNMSLDYSGLLINFGLTWWL